MTKRSDLLTTAMRESELWASFRAELQRRGHDPRSVVLIESVDDDEDVEVGLLETADRRLIAWRRHYSDEDPSVDRIVAWDDVTDGDVWASWGDAVFRGSARDHLARGRHRGAHRP